MQNLIFSHTFDKYLWGIYCEQCAVSGDGYATINKNISVPTLTEFTVLQKRWPICITQEVISITMVRSDRGYNSVNSKKSEEEEIQDRSRSNRI